MTLNLENITKWVEALESGDYSQGNGALARQDESTEQWVFCCLGVGCEMAIANGVQVEVKDMLMPRSSLRRYDDCDSYFPDSVKKWFGFDTQDPNLTEAPYDDHGLDENGDPEIEQITCSSANDNRGFDFVQIAGLIRQRYLS